MRCPVPNTWFEFMTFSSVWGWSILLLLAGLFVMTLIVHYRDNSPRGPMLVAMLCLVPLWVGLVSALLHCHAALLDVVLHGYGAFSGQLILQEQTFPGLTALQTALTLAVPLALVNLLLAAHKQWPDRISSAPVLIRRVCRWVHEGELADDSGDDEGLRD